MSNFEKNLSDSVSDFERLVKPMLIKKQLIQGNIISIELATADKHKDLIALFDTLSGIDAWIINNKTGIQGLASRIQWGEKNWQTFTVRYKLLSGNETEYQKRLNALESGEYLYPEYAVQAYITKAKTGHLLGLAIAKTLHIFGMIKAGMYWIAPPNSQNGTRFMCVSWEKMQHQGYPIKIYEE